MAEKLVGYIEQLSTNYQDLVSLNKYLKENEDIIGKWSGAVFDSILSYLDNSRHTLGIIHILYQKVLGPLGDVNLFFNQVQKLVDDATAFQVSMVPSRCTFCVISEPMNCVILMRVSTVGFITKRFVDECVRQKQPMRAVGVLRKAILRFRPTAETLTPLHAQFLQACLVSKCVIFLSRF
jgi:hypothetical protein